MNYCLTYILTTWQILRIKQDNSMALSGYSHRATSKVIVTERNC